jgi:hypothetical protein
MGISPGRKSDCKTDEMKGCQSGGMRATVSVNALAAAWQNTMTDTNKARPRDMTYSSVSGPSTVLGDGERTIPQRRSEIENSWCSARTFYFLA